MKDQQVPKLRFPEFSSDWEEKQLSEITNRYDNLRIPITSSKRISGKTPYYGANGIQDYVDGFTHEGEFILIAEDGANNLKNYPIKYVKGKIWVNNHAHVLQGKPQKMDNIFLANAMKTINFEPFLVGGGRAKLNSDVMMKLSIKFPDFQEQQKIGAFFKDLDDLIAISQKDLDQTKDLKSSLLQKMFPKKGAKVPEVRFPEFSGDWEEKQLSEVTNRYDNLRIPITSSKRISGKTPYYGANGIQDYVDGFTHEGEFILIAEDGANNLKNYPIKYVNGKIWVNNHAHVLQGKPQKMDNIFLANAMKKINFEPFLVGGGRAKLNSDVMIKLSIKFPDFQEQQKIGAFFKTLDELIEAKSKKLTHLKQQKQALLQQLFI